MIHYPCKKVGMVMNEYDIWVDKQLFRLRCGQFLEKAAEWLAGFFIAFGSFVLISKLAFPWMWPSVLWLGMGIVPSIIIAGYFASFRKYQKSEAIALLDKQLNAGGLLMTMDETRDAQWQQRTNYPEEVLNNSLVKIRPTRFFSYLFFPLVFATTACFIPLREILSDVTTPPAVSQQAVTELSTLMNILNEENVFDQKEKEELEKQIQQLLADTQNKPLTSEDWETVDALKQQMKLRLDEMNRTLDKAQSAVDSLYEDIKHKNENPAAKNSQGNPETTKNSSTAENGNSEKEANNENMESLTEEEIAKLEETLEDALNDLNENGGLEKMQGKKAGNMKKQLAQTKKLKLSKDGKEREESLEELKEFIEKECKECKQCNGQCEGECEGFCEGFDAEMRTANSNKPGRGGVSRGKADADMTWGKEADAANTKFKEIILPPGYLENPKETVLGVTLGTPQDEKVETAERNSAAAGSGATGSDAWNRQLHPRHKSIIKDYFDK